MNMQPEIILASASPRRRTLLEGAGVPFSVVVSQADEVLPPDCPPRTAVCKLARRKAAAVAAEHPDAWVIGADTLVSCGKRILGKPRSTLEAESMLRLLSGRTHHVQTGVCLALPNGTQITFCEVSAVTFRPLCEGEIRRYVATGEPMDKAGAYAIQGGAGAFVARISGDYANIVGLPVDRLRMLLELTGAVPPIPDGAE